MLSCVTGPPLLPVVENNYITAAFCQGFFFFFFLSGERKKNTLACYCFCDDPADSRTYCTTVNTMKKVEEKHPFVCIHSTNQQVELTACCLLSYGIRGHTSVYRARSKMHQAGAVNYSLLLQLDHLINTMKHKKKNSNNFINTS